MLTAQTLVGYLKAQPFHGSWGEEFFVIAGRIDYTIEVNHT